MMRLLTTPLILTFLLAGCAHKNVPVIEKAFFCDIEEKRKFSQEEIEWREVNAPWNLTKDYRTNLAWERENCESNK